jgi:hypothetical protein
MTAIHHIDGYNLLHARLGQCVDTALGKPPAPGYLTEITNAHLLFADQPEALPLFVSSGQILSSFFRDGLAHN